MTTIWKKGLISGLLIIVVLVGAAVWLGWSFSAHISDAQQQRLQKSPQYHEGGFVNIEPQAAYELTWEYLQDQFFGDQQREPATAIPVFQMQVQDLEKDPKMGLRAIWLGHASVLVEIDGYRILTDPVLSRRVSPFQFVGPKRFHPPPIQLKQLTGIDAVVISHNHYDHLDEATMRHLAGQGTKFLVPLGVGSYLHSWNIPNAQIHEMDWWEEKKIGKLTITSTPSRHYSGRGLFDYKATLWSSWSVAGPDHNVFYSGDSGYSKLFRQIGDRLGPFDLNIIKIGSYGPGDSWIDIHMTPEDAVRVHKDVGGKRMLPVHWGTFNLGLHAWDEPIKRAIKAAENNDVLLLTPRIGETVFADQPFAGNRWWEDVR